MKIRIALHIMMWLCYFGVAAMTNAAFMERWSFGKNLNNHNLLELMFEEKADRPFVYRQLMLKIVSGVEYLLPNNIKNHVIYHIKDRFFQGGDLLWSRVGVKYSLLYWADCLSIFFALLVLRRLSSIYLQSQTMIDFLPLAFGILLPMTFTQGGFYYDFPEILLSLLFYWSYLTNHIYLTTFFYCLAILNKESSVLLPFFLLPGLFWLSPKRYSLKQMGWMIFVGLTLYCIILYHYSGNPGHQVEIHLLENLTYYLNPYTYLDSQRYFAPRIPTPSFNNLIILIPVLIILVYSFKYANKELKLWFLSSILIMLPIFLIFGYLNEFRALDLIYAPVYLMIGQGIEHYYAYRKIFLYSSK